MLEFYHPHSSKWGGVKLTNDDQEYLSASFRDLINYKDSDPLKPVDPLTYRTPEGDTCLHIAAIRGDLRSVKLLVEAGLDVNSRADMGNTPLHYASRHKHQSIIDFLISKGAQTEITNEFGQKALQ